MLDFTQEKDQHINERLQKDMVMWLGTVRPNGKPHTVPVWFYWDGTAIIMFSKPKNQKLVNIRANNNVILAIDDTRGGEDVVTLEGTAELVEGTSVMNQVLAPYIAKYGELIKGFGWTNESMMAEYSQTIRITPTRFY